MAHTETAYAKINLLLHVLARRADGYHEIETVFAFVDSGDKLTIEAADKDRVTTVGEFACEIGNPFANLVAKALNILPRSSGLHVTLEKNLPVAAGLGGGSADAGAVFRFVGSGWGLPNGWQERAAKLGADVPACVDSHTVYARGIGTKMIPIASSLEDTPILLINPRVPLATGPVFKAWDGVDRGLLPFSDARTMALNGRNDLTAPAISLCPVIGDVLEALEQTDAWLTRMSGSGATCFALYDTTDTRDAASQFIRARYPEWWQMSGKLRE